MAQLGLYVGPRYVDVVEIAKTVAGPKITNFGRKDLYSKDTTPAPARRAGAPMSPQERITSAIKALLKEKKIKSKEVVSALPAEAVTVRFFEMPRLPQKEWETAVRFEAKKYIPFKIEEIVSDFQVIENKLDPKKMSVVFVAAKREALNNQMFLLNQSGLTPIGIDIIPFAFKRLFQFTKELVDEKKTAVMVNVSQNAGFITVLKEGAPCLTRDVSIAGDSKEVLYESLMGELRLSIGYFERQFPNSAVENLIICGEGDFEGWDVTMSNELKVPVKIANPAKSIKGAENMTSGLEIAAGLALKGFHKISGRDINLISDLVSTRSQQKLYGKVIIAEAVIAILLLSFMQSSMLGKVKKVKRDLSEVEKEGAKFTGDLSMMSVAQLQEKKDETEKRLAIFKEFVLNRVYWTFKFRDISKMLPDNLWLLEVALDERTSEGGGGVQRYLIIEGISWVRDKAASNTTEMAVINTYLTSIKNNADFLAGFSRIEGINIEKYKIGVADATKFRIVFSNKQ